MAQSSTIDRLAASLRGEIAELRPGERLAASRDLVRRHRASPVTVSRAIALLVAEGLVTTRPGAGTYVADRIPLPGGREADLSWQTVVLGDRVIDASALQVYLEPIPVGTISLAGGYAHPSLLPTRPLSAALSRAIRRADAWERPPLAGVQALRTWFAESIPGDITAEDIVITSGGQSALSVALRAIVGQGAPVLVEAPTYPGVLAAARAAGVRPMPVPTDTYGIRPDLLAETFGLTGARVVYVQPTFHNPTGTVLRAARRSELLDVAARAGAFVIEDDYARHLAHEGPAPPPLIADDEDGRVIYIASLTKAASPSLRVGALVARGPVAERLRALRIVDDFFVARFMQEAAVELVTSSSWQRHLASLSAALRRRKQTMLAALAADLPDLRVPNVPRGGMHVWAQLPDGVDESALAAACRQSGVLVSVGRPYFAAEPPGAFLRLSFSAAPHLDDIHVAVERLAAILK